MTETKHTALPWTAETACNGFGHPLLVANIIDANGEPVLWHIKKQFVPLVVTSVNERPALLAVRDAAKTVLTIWNSPGGNFKKALSTLNAALEAYAEGGVE